MELYALEQNNPEPSKKVLHLSSNALSACPLLPYSNGDHYSACPWTAACKALRACFWGQLATLWGPPQRKQRRGLEFVVEAPELFDEDDSFLWTGFTSPSPKLDRSILGMSIRLGSPCIPSPPRRKRLKGGRDRPWPHYCSACFPKREEATLTLLVF